jgi:hypothetical protein
MKWEGKTQLKGEEKLKENGKRWKTKGTENKRGRGREVEGKGRGKWEEKHSRKKLAVETRGRETGTEKERTKGGNYGIINLATHDSELIWKVPKFYLTLPAGHKPVIS